MFLNTDIFNFFMITKTTLLNYSVNNTIYTSILNDLFISNSTISLNAQNDLQTNFDTYQWIYLDRLYSAINMNNLTYFFFKYQVKPTINFSFLMLSFFNFFFKIMLLVYILVTIYFITNLENYIKQVFSVNMLSKLMILNASEKEVGPVDDYYFFAILFFLTVSIFIFSAIFLIVAQSNIFTWAVGGFLLLTILILSIPVNLFIDFGIVFCTVIRGSASSNNIIKELIFDIISTTTVFIRFVIQNIRFLFIFSGIFELLEWTLTNNSSLFLSAVYTDQNIFFNTSLNNAQFTTAPLNYLILNSVLFVILYFYYILHLLFLLLVQITVYLGISIWLFFFLYSTKFLNKFDKYLILKKLKN